MLTLEVDLGLKVLSDHGNKRLNKPTTIPTIPTILRIILRLLKKSTRNMSTEAKETQFSHLEKGIHPFQSRDFWTCPNGQSE